ncbi:hypothetical protein KIN20_016049 [Parelaphostrongylus tenuis]|uniref:Nuclear condensin complex subunit 3 C-terminal domain-containing protein n=1 Tax=Parelaphostrongylus tenuis TaxID=148309 RepID=A0AAD5N4U9_PARTN|nr:hypothetical protein KIN20_016049 [Parelaphostrongylus tenuis]
MVSRRSVRAVRFDEVEEVEEVEEECDETPGPSSPELGYQGELTSETNNATFSKCLVTPKKTSKKRGPRLSVANDEESIFSFLEDKISDAFETAYNSMCEAAGSKYASEILLAAYNKVREQDTDGEARFKTVFFEILQYRLAFMVESLVSLDNRYKVFVFITKFSVNLWREGVYDFVIFLKDFCETLRNCDDPAVRQNICTLTGLLLKEGGGIGSVGCDVRSISLDLRRRLYDILVGRQFDKVVAVRAEVIKSVADIQDDEIPNDFIEAIKRSPKDVILMGLRDVAADCRLTAVFALHVVVSPHCDHLIDVVSSDSCIKVRVAAIRQLARLSPTFLTEQQRMTLLRAVIFDEDTAVKDVVRDVLLLEWLSYIHRLQERKNKRKSKGRRSSHAQLRAMKQEESGINGDEPSDMFDSLRDVRCDHGMGSAAQRLLSMLDFCDEPQAERLCRAVLFSLFDVIRKKLRLDKNSLTHFVSSLVNDNTFPEVFVNSQLRNIDRVNGMYYMLSPPIHLMCDLVTRLRTLSAPVVDSESEEMAAPICDIQQVAVIHLLGILRHLDRRDSLGMSEWKSLLLSLLRDDSFSKEVTDSIMIDLVDVFFQGKPEQFLATVYDVTSEAIQCSELSDNCTENRESSSTPMSNGRTRRFCMQLVHSMLRTGIFKKYTPVLRKVYGDIISSCLSFKGSQVYLWALEASGILALIAQEVAKTALSEALEAFKTDDKTIKMSSIDIITDLIVVYGFKDVLSWQHSDQADPEESIHNFISELLKILKTKDIDPLCIKACQCVSKIVLLESINEDVTPFADVVACLISRLFHSSTRRSPEVKSCLEKFFAIFPSIRRRNQLVMVAAFHELMSTIRKSSGDDFVLHIDIDNALDLFVNATKDSFLHQAADMELGSVQPKFMRELLEYLLDHPDDTCACLYWTTVSRLDLESFSSVDLTGMKEIAQKILEDVTGVRSGMANEAHRLIRNIDCVLYEIETRNTEEAEGEDRLTELREKTTRTSRYGRRQTPKSTLSSSRIKSSLSSSVKKRKVTSNVKRSTQELLHSERSPSPPPILSSLVNPTPRSRPILSRAAKAAAISKTSRALFDS